MKILIAVPTFETIAPEVFKAIYDMDKGGHDVDFDYVRGYDCAKARNVAVQKATHGNYDYLMMVDSDTIPPRDALVNMLEFPADLVIGCCPRKNSKTHEVTLYPPDPDNYHHMMTYPDLPDASRIKVRGGGAACILINVQMLKELSYPYFKYIVYDNGDTLSEDLFFCSKVRKSGYKIEADTRVRCGHIMKHIEYS